MSEVGGLAFGIGLYLIPVICATLPLITALVARAGIRHRGVDLARTTATVRWILWLYYGLLIVACVGSSLYAYVSRMPEWPLPEIACYNVFIGPLVAFTVGCVYYNAYIKHPNGLCPGCGYALIGNRTGRCSECGRPVRAPSAPPPD